MATNRTRSELDAAIDHLRTSPKDSGRLELIVRRPAENQREVLRKERLIWTKVWSVTLGVCDPVTDRQVVIRTPTCN